MSFIASELYLASATLPISWILVNSGYGRRLCEAAGPRRHLVGVEHPLEPFAAGPEVADLERRDAAELALDVEHVLNHVRRLAVVHVAEDVVIRHADERRLHAARRWCPIRANGAFQLRFSSSGSAMSCRRPAALRAMSNRGFPVSCM